ncbi:MAG: GrpB family protein, partial [Gaiellaceae bacterium]
MADGLIVVVPYDPEWPHRFEVERALLERVLAPWLDGGIHHIGATSVPGLAAKPIIAILAGVRDFKEAREAFEPLCEQSYVHTPHRPRIAHHFSKPSARLSDCRFSLHLTEPRSDLWRERLAYRDALRADRALVAEYQALKLQLAQEQRTDVAAYTDGKRAFVAR